MIEKIKKIRISLLKKLYSRIPIKNNKVIFWSNSFKDYGCNPKYIAEYLSKNYDDNKLDIVYVLNHDVDIPNNIPENIRIVRYFSKQYLYELLTSKIIITNHRIPEYYFFDKRKGQVYIQTWHSSTRLKKIEKDALTDLSEEYINFAKKDSNKCDVVISGSKFSTNIFKNSFWYDGKILEFGTPRSDILFNKKQDINKKIKKYYNISDNTKLLLYAPTFRKDKSLDVYNLNYNMLISTLKEKYGGEWAILIRLHPNLSNIKYDINKEENIYNASKYNDIQELIAASDILITDYSSCMFDFGLINKPCFLYTPDLNKYLKTERQLYFDIKELPFKYSITNGELIKNILEFDEDEYRNKCKKFSEYIGTFEDGNATQKLCQYIYDICNK